MRMIESSSNPRIQRARKILLRRDPDYFLVEGAKLFEEAIRSRMKIEEAYVTQEAMSENAQLIHDIESRNVAVNRISPRLTKLISDLETPPGLIAILKRPQSVAGSIKRLAICLIGVRDPGNVGAIVRSAEGAGCDAVFHADGADPFQPKAVRASMGSIFRMPVVAVADPVTFLSAKKTQNVEISGLVTQDGVALNEWNTSFPALICVGSESHGLPAELPIAKKISIPMEGSVESLNAAVAASICLYWIRLTCRNQS